MEADTLPKIVIVVGPTGSGKTALSLSLSERYNGEVINADSRQVYRGLDIGTEKIEEAQMRGIPHHLLSIVDPKEIYTAVRFKNDAEQAIADITARKKLPIIAGGTFFYIDTLLQKASAPEVPPDHAFRSELEEKDTESLFQELTIKDPERAKVIDKHNKRRLMRALEIIRALGKVPQVSTRPCPYNTLIIGLSVEKDVLRARLKTRAQRALERGLIEETEHLLSSGVSVERLNEIGLEYKLTIAYLHNEISKNELIQRLEEKNWQYAKRQMVWLKRDDAIVWYTPEDTDAIFKEVDRFLAN